MRFKGISLVIVTVAFAAICIGIPNAHPAVHYVSTNGLHLFPYTNWVDAATNIQAAINSTTNGETVLVSNGIYNVGETVVQSNIPSRIAITNAITVRSVNGSAYTTIEGMGSIGDTNVVRCAYVDAAGAVLDGFTLTKGCTLLVEPEVEKVSGGGAMCGNGAIINCRIVNNEGVNGSGVLLYYGGIVSNCVITGNFSFGNGGGAYCYNGGTIRGSSIDDNFCTGDGGGVYCYYGGLLQNCSIAENTGQNSGGGISCNNGGTIENSIIFDNTKFLGSGDNYYNEGSNITYSFSCTTPLVAGTSNIIANPLLTDAAGGDLRLLPGSPCIDTGTNMPWMVGAKDLDGLDRIMNNAVDIGAHEYIYYEIVATAGANGSIVPSGTTVVARASNANFLMMAATNYHILDVFTNGASIGPTNSYTFVNVTTDQTIHVDFAIDTFTLSVTSQYGIAVPSGVVTSDWNALINCALTNSPIPNGVTTQYVCSGWTGTGSVTPGFGTNMSFNITNNSTLTWQWETNYWLDTAAGSNGTVDISDGWFKADTNVTLTAIASNGYHFVDWTGDLWTNVNPWSLLMDQPHSVTGNFEINVYNIIATVETNGNGTISPSGVVQVVHGSGTNFIFTPNTNYHVLDVFTNGTSIGPTNGFTFVNVITNHTIRVEFTIDTFTLSVTTAHGGAVPTGITTNGWNSLINASITNSPVSDGSTTQYVCIGWTGTGSVTSGLGTNVSFNITNDSTIAWNWKTQYLLAASAGINGSVTASNGWHDLGSNVVALATPDTGYHFTGWTGDTNSLANPLNLTMLQSYAVTANFALTIHYVSPFGTHAPPYTNWIQAATNIQAAVDAASVGEQVLVTNGVYSLGAEIAVTNAISILSVNGPLATIVDGNKSVRCFNQMSSNVVVEGFTIREGRAPVGGGVYCSDNGTVRNCIVTANTAGKGGGIHLSAGAVAINCLITDNSAAIGGGVSFGSGGTVQNCTVAGNSATDKGGGVHSSSISTVQNSILYLNIAGTGPNHYLTGSTNCSYTCTFPSVAGVNNLTNNPLLTSSYRLRNTSPCIDAGIAIGSPVDIEGESRWDHAGQVDVVSIWDIGSDEFVDDDGDQMADLWEIQESGNTNLTAAGDDDSDLLSNLQEYQTSTSPTNNDTDGDSLNDRWELKYGFDPLSKTGGLWGITSRKVGGYDTAGQASDIYVSGTNAYLADGANGLVIVNVTDPTNCLFSGGYDTAGSANDVYVSGTNAYLADGTNGLVIVNVTDPAGPLFSGGYNTAGLANGIHVSGTNAYLADGANGLVIVNVTDPAGPLFSGGYNTAGLANGIHVSGTNAYLADGANGLVIVNVTDPAGPLFSDSCNTGGDARAIHTDGNQAYVADRTNGMAIIDISDAANCVQTGGCYVVGAVGIDKAGSYAYVAGSWGVDVIDVSNPGRSIFLGSYPVDEGCSGVTATGGYVYATSPTGGLHVIEISVSDSDADGLLDSWEMNWWGNLAQSPTNDPDSDGISNWGEYLAGLNPTNPDTDGDNLTDGDEVNIYYLDPNNPDTDNDGFNDGVEVATPYTDPDDIDSFPASISGQIFYSGFQTGTIWVTVTDLPTFTNVISMVSTGSYNIVTNPTLANYLVSVYRDSNGNLQQEVWEATGSYSNNPILLTNDITGIDIVMTEPDFNFVTMGNPTEEGVPLPTGYGTNVVSAFTTLSNRVNYRAINATTQLVCLGWTGTGSVPSTGSNNWVEVTVTNDSTLTWNWQPDLFYMTMSTGSNGTVDATSGWYAATSVLTNTATPSNGYHLVDWTGTVTSTNNPLILTNDQAYSLTASFSINIYDINASAGSNGVITPSGIVQVAHGGSTNFIITPDPNYHILNVDVDGSSIGVTNSYTFSNVTSNHSIDAAFEIDEYVLMVTSPYGTAIPTGSNSYDYGSSISCSVTDAPVVVGTTQYVCVGWIGAGSVPAAGAATNVTFTFTNDSSLVWQWRTNYWLDTTAGSNGWVDVADGWFSHGSNMTIVATPSNGYHFLDWTGDISTTNNPIVFAMDKPYALAAAFDINIYDITVTIGANGSVSPTGTIQIAHGGMTNFVITPDTNYYVADVLIDGLPIGPTNSYTFLNVTNDRTIEATFDNRFQLIVSTLHGAASPSGTNLYEYGTNITGAILDSPVTIGTTQYVCTGWIGTASVPASGATTNVSFVFTNDSTITWTWATNYWLNIVAGPNGGVDTTSGWYAAGSVITNLATESNGYYFVNWTGTVTSASNPIALSMIRSYSQVANFSINIYNIAASSGANGTISPSGPVPVAHGGATNFTITPSLNYHVLDVVVDSASVGATNAYSFSNVTSNHSIDVTFEIDNYQLTVSTGHGTAVPVGINQYDYGTNLTCAIVDSPVVIGTTQYVCTGWVGTGSVPPAGAITNVSFVFTNDSTIVWQWTTNYWLDTTAGANGQVDVPDGWISAGSNVVITPTPSNNYHLVGWTGDVTSTNNPLVLTMSRTYAVTATFAIDMYDIVASAGPDGSISPNGLVQVPYDGTTNFTITADPNAAITNVLVDGVPIGPTNSYTFANVVAAHTIQALFAMDQSEFFVTTPYGTVTPSGSNTFEYGSNVACRVLDSPVVIGTTQYVCTGWIGTGSVPPTGTGTNLNFVLTNTSTLSWQWITNYWLDTTAGANGTVNIADGWFTANSNVVITALPDASYGFTGWTGDVPPADVNDNPLSLTIVGPHAITAAFSRNPHYVSTNGASVWPYTTWATAARSVQDAVNAAAAGWVVYVSNGTYTLSSSITITKGVTVESVNGNAVTTIDGDQFVRCFRIDHSNAVVDGFTITGGNTLGNGAGVELLDGIVQNCNIVNNAATNYGGGVHCNGGGMVTNCTISGNIANYGGGIHFTSNGIAIDCTINGNSANYGGGVRFKDGGIVRDCTIQNNSASDEGGGVGILRDGSILNSTISGNSGPNYGGGVGCDQGGIVSGCTISGNSANYGGGVHCNSGGTVTNCTINGNTAAYGAGVRCKNGGIVLNTTIRNNNASLDGGGVQIASGGTVQDCTIRDNTSVNYGAGVSLHEGGSVRDSSIRSNTGANYGGGVHCLRGGTVDGCSIAANSADGYGGGIRIKDGGTAQNCLVYNNSAPLNGGGVAISRTGTVQNCTITRNTSGSGGGLYCYEGGILRNTIIYLNNASTATNYLDTGSGMSYSYSCSEPQPAGQSNISVNPLFVDDLAANYHLLEGSPCIDTGTATAAPNDDLDGVPRPLDGNADATAIVDIGAYEFASTNVDADGDLLSDGAEVSMYGTNPLDNDSDDDGMSDGGEVIAGTAPMNPSDYFGLGTQSNSIAEITWQGVIGRLYTASFTTNLVAGIWANDPSYTDVPGIGGTMIYTNSSLEITIFYRISVKWTIP